MSKTAVSYTEEQLLSQARQLAEKLQLPLCEITAKNFSFLLVLTPSHLELRSQKENFAPLYIDFTTGKMGFRHKHSTSKNELLARAVGIKGAHYPNVIDATAGLGRDAFLLASLGCKVTLLERSAILAELLQDGLKRYKMTLSDGEYFDCHLIAIDAINYLQNLSKDQYPEVIYLDPMYPERKKSALVKKEMRILRDLVGDDPDFVSLFDLAIQRTKNRVVVKRPSYAPYCKEIKPEIEFVGNNTRFDVYLG